jgi:hypothetical protein
MPFPGEQHFMNSLTQGHSQSADAGCEATFFNRRECVQNEGN